MATNKLNLNEIEKELDKLLADRAAEVEKARKMLIDAEKLAGKAESELAAAEEKDSVEAYAKAAQGKRAAEDTVAFYKKKVEQLERSPISAVDSGKIKAEITAALDRRNTAAMGKIVELVSQMQEIGAELGDEFNHANKVLDKLQRKIVKQEPDYHNGKWEYDKWELVRFCTQFTNSSWYQELVKKGGVGR